jgi:cytochrome c peroxidase
MKSMNKKPLVFFSVTFFLMIGLLNGSIASDIHDWSEGEVHVLRSLWIGSLPPIPDDPSNAYDDNPKATELGKKFFFDHRFSGNLKVAEVDAADRDGIQFMVLLGREKGQPVVPGTRPVREPR